MIETKNKPRIVIAGAGNIGFFIGGLLHHAGQKVSFLARERLIGKIQTHGLHITDYSNLNVQIDKSKLQLNSSPLLLAEADIILVTVKSSSTKEIADLINQHAKTSATIISLQNGISNSTILKHVLTNHTVLAGMVPFNVTQMDKARFHRGTSGNIIIEAGQSKLASILSTKHLFIEESDEIANIQSGKLLINLNNALNALSGIPLLEQLNNRYWRHIMADQMSEALAIMQLAGMKPKPPSPVPARFIPNILRLPTPLFKLVAKQMLTIDPHARSSMWEDLENGRKTEIYELQDEIIQLAKKFNRVAPINYRVMSKILEAEKRGKGSPRLKPEDV